MRYSLLLLPFILAACSADSGGVIKDPQAFLGAFGGPKVPTISDSLLDSAHAAESEGNFLQAAIFYKQLVDKHPENKEYRLMLADALRRGGNPDRALAEYDGILKIDASSAHAQEGKALVLLEKGDADAAEKLLSSVRASDPKRWRAPNALGVIAASRQNFTAAQADLQEALKASPGNPSVLNNLGLVQAMNKEFDAALSSMAQAQAAAGNRPTLRKQIDLNTALIYAAAGKLDDAQEITKHYYTGAALDNNMGFYAHIAHDDQLAQTYLNMALTQSKTFYQRAWNNLEVLKAAPSMAAGNAPATPKLMQGKLIAPAAEQTKPVELTKPDATKPVEEPAEPAQAAAPAMPVVETPVAEPKPAAQPAETIAVPATAAQEPVTASPEAPSDQPKDVTAATGKPEEKQEKGNGFQSVGRWVKGLF